MLFVSFVSQCLCLCVCARELYRFYYNTFLMPLIFGAPRNMHDYYYYSCMTWLFCSIKLFDFLLLLLLPLVKPTVTTCTRVLNTFFVVVVGANVCVQLSFKSSEQQIYSSSVQYASSSRFGSKHEHWPVEKQLPQLQVIVIKHQTLDMEFLAIWLALYSRYKSHTL